MKAFFSVLLATLAVGLFFAVSVHACYEFAVKEARRECVEKYSELECLDK